MSTRYLFLIYGDESADVDMTPEQWEQTMAAHNAWSASVAAVGATVVSAEALQPTAMATTVRTDGPAPVVTDGPFAELKEALGGFYLVDCADLDQALELARTLPADVVEVRPILPTG
jgi:hypothetical protein